MEKDIAKHVKKEFDAKYTPTWHCIVGKSFGKSNLPSRIYNRSAAAEPSHDRGSAPCYAAAGSFVTHEAKHFTYFYLGGLCCT